MRRGTVGAHARTSCAALILRNPVQGRMYAGRFNHCDDAGHITHSSVLDRGR